MICLVMDCSLNDLYINKLNPFFESWLTKLCFLFYCSLLLRFTDDTFDPEQAATIGRNNN